MTGYPENIYVLKCFGAEKREPDGSTEDVTLLGTYTDLTAAKIGELPNSSVRGLRKGTLRDV
jgi:hypothetical protein